MAIRKKIVEDFLTTSLAMTAYKRENACELNNKLLYQSVPLHYIKTV